MKTLTIREAAHTTPFEVQLRDDLDEAFDEAEDALNLHDMDRFHRSARRFHEVANQIEALTGVDPRGKGKFQ